MTVRVAYVEEPPFYWTAADGTATGADVELARVVLATIGETSIEFVPVAFDELLPGVSAGRWELNVPIFVTREREQFVTFSVPVWSLSDGFIVQRGNPKSLTGYPSVRTDATARLGLIPGQVQFDAAVAAGIPSERIVSFAGQTDAVAALCAGQIDAFAATNIGNRAVVTEAPELEAVAFAGPGAFGAFSFAPNNTELIEAVNAALNQYLGSDDHRTRMAAFGITSEEIDSALRPDHRDDDA